MDVSEAVMDGGDATPHTASLKIVSMQLDKRVALEMLPTISELPPLVVTTKYSESLRHPL